MGKKSDLIDPTIPAPSGTYLVFIEKVTSTKTKIKPGKGGGHPMAVFDLQVIAPNRVETERGPIDPTGRQLKWYMAFTPRNKIPVDQTEKLLNTTLPDDFDEVGDCILPLAAKRGECFEAALVSEPFYKTDNGKWNGNPILGEDGQPIVAGYRLAFKEPLSAIEPVPQGVTVKPVAGAEKPAATADEPEASPVDHDAA